MKDREGDRESEARSNQEGANKSFKVVAVVIVIVFSMDRPN